tara:strand:+ start:1003 stop:2814 length:1812 start_codon:yes stop_codon:yes gene_type:complete
LSDIILKGEGVFYFDGKEYHDQTFPPEESDHENISHFHINSKTGKPFKELEGKGLVGKWPMEIAAGILAREIMEQGYKDENGVRRKPTTESDALRSAKRMMNEATEDFNKTKRAAGDDYHTLKTPFDLANGGILHPEYATNHYGGHESRRKSTAERRTRTDDGRLIVNHPRNQAHEKLGQHLESAALHIFDELEQRAKKNGIKTSLGAEQNVIEPQQLTQGITHRYTSNDKPPGHREHKIVPSHYKDLHAQTAAYGQISPMDIVSVLPSDFFYPSTAGGMSTRIMNQLMEMGYDQPTARAMARAPVNQLLYGSGKEGRESGLNKVVRNMRAKMQVDDNDDIHAMFKNHLSHIAPKIRGGDNGRNNKAIEILALLKTGEELGVEPADYSMYPSAPASVMDNWREVALSQGGSTIDMAALGSVDERHDMRGNLVSQDSYHRHEKFPSYLSGGSFADILPPTPIVEEPLSQPPAVDFDNIEEEPPVPPQQIDPLGQQPRYPLQDLGFSDMSQFNPFQLSDDDPMGVIATIMERVQMHDAGGSLLVKYDPMDNYDMHKLGQNVGMSSNDVRAIAMSLGDWEIIAKSFNTTHDVVRAIKRSVGGALNG